MRIASLSPAATEILFALGLSKEIVCTDQFSNFPDEAKKIPHVRDHQKIRGEDLKAFVPECVITGTIVQEKLAAQLKREDFAVIHQDPRTLNGVYEAIRQLGVIFLKEKEAGALILSMQQAFNAVKKKAALLPKKLRVYVEEWPALQDSSGRHLSPMASGNWIPELIRIAGGEPFPIPSGNLSREVTLEEVSGFDPDLIVISWCGAGNLAEKKLLTERAGWDQWKAVREGQVRVIDDSLLNRPGPRLVEGAQHLYGWMFEMLH